MSIFTKIKDAIFGKAKSKSAPTPSSPPIAVAPSAPQPAPRPTPQPATVQTLEPIDVEAVLTELAQHEGPPLNWRTSIVDLLKLLDLDSSLTARKELAAELNYTGDTNDSAAMNIWLHKQVMQKLAENGGRVPAALRD